MYFDQDTRFNDDTVKFINKYVDENSNLGWHNDYVQRSLAKNTQEKQNFTVPPLRNAIQAKIFEITGWHDNSIFLTA